MVLISHLCVISVSAKGWKENSIGFIGYMTHVRDFYLINNILEFHCLEYQPTSENNEYVVKKADWLGQEASFNYLYGSRDVITSSGANYNKLDVVKTNNNLTVATYYNGTRESTLALSANYTRLYRYTNSNQGGSVVFESNTSDSYYMAYTSSGSSMTMIKKKVTSTTNEGINSFSVANNDGDWMQPTDGIEISDRNVLLGDGQRIIKLYYNGESYVVQNRITLPSSAYALKFFKLDDGSIFAYSNMYGQSEKIIIYKLDSNGNILKTYDCPYKSTYYSFNDSEPICKKSSNSFLLTVRGNDNSYFNLLEFDSSLNLISTEVLNTPPSILTNPNYTVRLNNIKYINKKLYIVYEVYGVWTNNSPNAYYCVYEPIPPTGKVTARYANIGDNTPVILDISTSETYPILCVFNEGTQQPIYWGAPQSTFNYYWNEQGNINLSIRLHDADGTLLAGCNTVTINKNDLLAKMLVLTNTKPGLQQFIVMDDVDRYYETNGANQYLVEQIKSNVSGTFLIYNDVSDVLSPLLE